MTRRIGLLLAMLAVASVMLRWCGLSRESLWFDEGMSWWLASLSPHELLRVIRGDVAAPLHYLLLHGWRAIFGDTGAAMRAMSALAATLTLVPFYFVARRLIRSHAALLVACGLMAISYMQIQYAKEARYYALLALEIMTALACIPTLTERRSWAAMAGFIMASAAGLYTHNIMMFYLAGLDLAWMIWPGQRSLRARLLDIALANLVIVLAYTPWVPVLLRQMRWMTGTFWAKRPGAFDLGTVAAAITGVDVWGMRGPCWRLTGFLPSPGSVGVMAGACLILAIVLQRRRGGWALAAFLAGPVIAVFLYSLVRQPIFFERIFIASSAAVPILLAMTIDTGRPRSIRIVGGVVVALVGVMSLMSIGPLLTEHRKEDWRGAYAAVAALPASNQRLIVFVANEGEMPFAYYAAHDPSRPAEPRTGAPQGFLDLDPPQTIRRVTRDQDLVNLRRNMNDSKWNEIVLVLSHTDFSDPDALTERQLRSSWHLVDEQDLRLVRVLRFRREELSH